MAYQWLTNGLPVGFLRFLLALSIVIAHIDNVPFGYRLVPGDLAAQCFLSIVLWPGDIMQSAHEFADDALSTR
jgi:hypothetical protein